VILPLREMNEFYPLVAMKYGISGIGLQYIQTGTPPKI
jgi:hypothetical protein